MFAGASTLDGAGRLKFVLMRSCSTKTCAWRATLEHPRSIGILLAKRQLWVMSGRRWSSCKMSAKAPRADTRSGVAGVRYGPCVDGSGLSRDRSRRSAGRSSHVFGLSVRLTGPLAIMPSADRVPVKSSHSTMLWPKWVVPITGSTGSALRAVSPFQPFHHAVAGAISSVSLRPIGPMRQVPDSSRPWPSSPRPCARSCWRARSRRPSSAGVRVACQATDDA